MQPEPGKKPNERSALLTAAGLLLFGGFLGMMILAASLPLFDDFVFRVVVAQAVGAGVLVGALVAFGGAVGGLVALVMALRTPRDEGQEP